jgi:hypothetical protein
MGKRGRARGRGRRAVFYDPAKSLVFLAEGLVATSAIAGNLEHGMRPVVQLSVNGRWNHGATDELVLLLDPAVARDLGDLREAADAADRDLADYLAGRAVVPHGLAHGAES